MSNSLGLSSMELQIQALFKQTLFKFEQGFFFFFSRIFFFLFTMGL